MWWLEPEKDKDRVFSNEFGCAASKSLPYNSV